MTRGLLIGLVLGFALGAGVVCVGRPAPGIPAPTIAPAPPAPRDRPAAAGVPATERAPPPAGDAPAEDDEDILGAIEELARTGVPPPGRNLNHYSGRLANATLARRLVVPDELIERLIARPEMVLRWLGFRLVGRGCGIPAARFREAALGDPEPAVRTAALQALAATRSNTPEYAEVVAAAAEDPSPRVRREAIAALGSLASRDHPELQQLVLAATRDPDPAVRNQAMVTLGSAGEAGAARAVEILGDGDFESYQLDVLAGVAAAGGRALDLLGDGARPEVVTALLEQLDAEETPDTVRSLAGRFEELLPLYQPEDAEVPSLRRFFRLAVAGGDRAFVTEVINDRERRPEARLAALGVALTADEGEGLAAARRLLVGGTDPARFRARALRTVIDSLEEPVDRTALRKLAADVAASDPSVWVREPAEELVRDLDDRED